MQTIIGQICADIATLMSTPPFDLFLGFAILGLVVAIIIRVFHWNIRY